MLDGFQASLESQMAEVFFLMVEHKRVLSVVVLVTPDATENQLTSNKANSFAAWFVRSARGGESGEPRPTGTWLI